MGLNNVPILEAYWPSSPQADRAPGKINLSRISPENLESGERETRQFTLEQPPYWILRGGSGNFQPEELQIVLVTKKIRE